MSLAAQLEAAEAAAAAGQLAEAAALFDAVLAARPDMAEALEGRALVDHRAGRHAEAAERLALAAARAPHQARIHYHLGLALQALGRPDEAAAAYRRAVALRPNDPDTLSNLGLVLAQRGELEPSRIVLTQATRLAPRRDDLWTNLGVTLQHACDLPGAIAAHRRAVALAPGQASHRYNLALSLLQSGAFKEGWAEYEHRWKAAEFKAQPRPFDQPRWTGDALGGRSLLAWSEQGIGDQILYAGMLGSLALLTDRLVVECAPRLQPLFARSFPFGTVIAASSPPDPATATDLQIPMPSLGGILRARAEDFPPPEPYLRAHPRQTEAIRARAPGRGPHIGLSWASHAPGRASRKTVPLPLLRPILDAAPGADFVSLQYGPVEADLAAHAAAGGPAIRRDAGVEPLLDLEALAAQIAGLDLVITVSNTTAHLAGALGVPCWVLVPSGGGQIWYWFQSRPDSPFYPGMRFFRQARPGDWAPPVAELAAALARRVSAAGTD